MSNENDDFLRLGVDDTYEANNITDEPRRIKRSEDPRFWKPSVKNVEKSYEAVLRLLPAGIDGLRNKLPASIENRMHYVKEEEHGLRLFVPCRKVLGTDEPCAICQANDIMKTAAKAIGNKDLEDKAYDRRGTISHVGNVYVRQDITNPKNSGQVRLWERSNKLQTVLRAPMMKKAEVKGTTLRKSLDRFNPYSPADGRDFFLVMVENPTNKIPTYDESRWDDAGASVLAPTKEEMVAILEKCYPLTEFIQDVPSFEKMLGLWNDFSQKLAEKTNGTLSNPLAGRAVHMGGIPINEAIHGSAAPAQAGVVRQDGAAFFGVTPGAAPATAPVAAAPAPQAAPVAEAPRASLRAPAAAAAPAPQVEIPIGSDNIGADEELPF
jgi:hypothetical protein